MKPVSTIEMYNAVSQLHTHPSTLDQVRHHVSYQRQALPPPAVQRVIKECFVRIKRQGRERDLERIQQDPLACQELQSLGFPIGSLTPRSLESVIELRGEWDGWQTLVHKNGLFGTGLTHHVYRALTLRLGHDVQFVDRRAPPPVMERAMGQMPSLYTFQEEAVGSFLQAGRGVIACPPRSGKTRIAIAVIASLKLPTLYVVPTIGLVNQTVDAMREFLDHDEVIGITGGKPNRKKRLAMAKARVWIATPQTAAGGVKKKSGPGSRTMPPGIAGIGTRHVLIIDEFHHAAAPTYQAISLAAKNAYYRLGLTGTHFRADGRDLEMHSVLQRAICAKTIPEMVDLDRLVPAHFAFVRVPGDNVARYRSGNDLRADGIIDHEGRNALGAWAAWQLMERGKRVLMLAKEVRHAEEMSRRIPGSVQVDGRDNSEVDQVLKDLQAGRTRCVVGTSVIGEGRDVPAADAMVYLPGSRSKVKYMQDTFRVLTQSPGKDLGLVIDFADQHHPRLMENASERLRICREVPCFQSGVIDAQDLPAWIDRQVA